MRKSFYNALQEKIHLMADQHQWGSVCFHEESNKRNADYPQIIALLDSGRAADILPLLPSQEIRQRQNFVACVHALNSFGILDALPFYQHIVHTKLVQPNQMLRDALHATVSHDWTCQSVERTKDFFDSFSKTGGRIYRFADHNSMLDELMGMALKRHTDTQMKKILDGVYSNPAKVAFQGRTVLNDLFYHTYYKERFETDYNATLEKIDYLAENYPEYYKKCTQLLTHAQVRARIDFFNHYQSDLGLSIDYVSQILEKLGQRKHLKEAYIQFVSDKVGSFSFREGVSMLNNYYEAMPSQELLAAIAKHSRSAGTAEFLEQKALQAAVTANAGVRRVSKL